MKKGYKLILLILILGIFFGVGSFFCEKYKENKLKKHVFEEYRFELSYPDSYKSVKKSGDDGGKITSNIVVSESGENLSEYMSNMKFVETLEELKDAKKQIRILVEAIEKEKTTLSLEEICKRHVVMFKIYNEESKVLHSETEIIKLDEKEAGKVTIQIEGKEDNVKLVAYLISLDDREITITFIAPEKAMDKFKNELDKIISSLKID